MSTLDRREMPQYSLAEASLFLDVRPTTLRSWVFGRSYRAKGQTKFWPPLVQPAARAPNDFSLSFFNLAEIHVLSATRGYDVSVKAIREAIAYVSEEFPSAHPLISQEFHTDGKDLFIKKLEGVINASRRGQLGLKEVLESYLRKIRRDDAGLPLRLFPVVSSDFDNKVVCIAPDVASGSPIIDQRGIRVSVIWQRHQAGETISELAADYEVEPSEIEQAISYSRHIRQAA